MRAPYVLYREETKSGLIWYVKFWDPAKSCYSSCRSLGVPVEGKRERRKEAEEKAAQLFRVEPTIDATAPLVQYVTRFWADGSDYLREKAEVKKTPLSSAYLRNNRDIIRMYLEPWTGFSGVTLGNFSRPVIRSLMLYLSGLGLSGRRINAIMQVIRVPLADAAENELIPASPFRKADKAYHKKRDRGILTPAEVQALIDAPADDIYARISVLLGCLCGMRRGEVRGLQWDDIADGLITVQHNQVDGDGMKSPKIKGGMVQENTRHVPLPADLSRLLDRVRPIKKSKYVIESKFRHADPVSSAYFKFALQRELEGIGITAGKVATETEEAVPSEQKSRNLVFHSLRHTFISHARFRWGWTDLEIQKAAGHSDIETTGIYTHDEVIDFASMRTKQEAGMAKSG
ncbi:tyrosine-type recombinase/integrase [Treponema primitia]|uniref:tyrosine-type recombinase/integrase n=1 Tax=Treponema primitia TaxID=88058 RepID=UPI0039818848